MQEEINVVLGVEQHLTLIHQHHRAIRKLQNVLLNLKLRILFNFVFHIIIRDQYMMAHTKQTPRNPNVNRPTIVIGSDVQPE